MMDLSLSYQEVLAKEQSNFNFPGRGQQDKPRQGAKDLMTIMNLLQGERAARFRAAEADVLVKYLCGDLSLIRGVQGIRQAQEALADSLESMWILSRSWAISQRRNEQLGTMVDRAEKLMAIKPNYMRHPSCSEHSHSESVAPS